MITDHRFPRSARLVNALEFRRVFADPRRSADNFFTILSGAERPGIPRLGLAISKKYVRCAVDRNRLKRLIREAFRHHRSQLPGIDLIVLPRTPAATADNARLRASLNDLFARLRRHRS